MKKRLIQEAIEYLGDAWKIKSDGKFEYLYYDFGDGYECKIYYRKDNETDEFCVSVYSSKDKGDNKRKPVKKGLAHNAYRLNEVVHNLHIAAKLAKPDEYEPDECLEFVWGIKSADDLTGNDCNIYTMNDFEIDYDNENNHYIIGLETIYRFKKPEYAKEYAMNILKEFTKFMCDNGLDTNYKLSLYDVFTEGCTLHNGYDSIEELYAAFKLLVNGFCSLSDNEN